MFMHQMLNSLDSGPEKKESLMLWHKLSQTERSLKKSWESWKLYDLYELYILQKVIFVVIHK